MKFSDIRGNDHVKTAFVNMVQSGRIPHAILMYENEGCGALALALAFVQYLNCGNREGKEDSCGACISCNQNSKLIYPDVHFSFPITTGTKVSGEVSKIVCDDYAKYWKELVLSNPYFLENELTGALGIDKKSGAITVAEGKSILKKLSLTTVSGGYRAIIMWLPEKMNVQTANMLLKSIEEPPAKTVFILITHSPEEVLQTISSRCLNIRVLPAEKQDVAQVLENQFGKSADEASEIAGFSSGSVGFALHSLSEESDAVQFKEIFFDLLNDITAKNYISALETGETLAALESREKQKAFCIFASDCVRKIFLLQQGMKGIAGVRSEDEENYVIFAQKLSKTFSRKTIDILNRAYKMLDRNVNQKIIFTNVVSRMFASA